MHLVDHFQLMARYNQWMNETLYQVCADIPDEDRKQDLGAFFKSIHATLNHILYGDKAWMGRFTHTPFYAPNMGQNLYADFDQLRAERQATDCRILDWSQTLAPDWLTAQLDYKSTIDNKTRRLPTWVLVAHMFNHQTHHRGQVTTLIKQLGHEPGITDLPWLPDFEVEDT